MSIPESPSLPQIAERFATPDARRYGPVPIWWWSGAPLTRERLRWQMEQLLSQGVAQAVVMNLAPSGPLYGSLPDDPPYMSEEWWAIFADACRDAEELGFSFWLYDQLGFSGANFQGRLVAAHPEWAGWAIDRVVARAEGGATRVEVPAGAHPIAAYARTGNGIVPVGLSGSGAEWTGAGELVVAYRYERGFDYYRPEAFAALLDSVHGEFERRVGDHFGSTIVGVFQDELPSMPTWSEGFADEFRRRAGYDLVPEIAALWGDEHRGDEHRGDADADAAADRAALVRRDYHRVRAQLAAEATFTPLAEWHHARGLQSGFDQQSPAREGDPTGTARTYADYLTLHSGFTAPGADHLGDPKVHSSLAHLTGGSRSWIEAFHSSGWGGTLEETYDWLTPFLRRGATLYDPHAVYYSTQSGWWEWAPPSTCWRQPYWGQYHLLSGAVARLSELFTRGRLVCDTALLFPTASAQAASTLAGRLPGAEHTDEVYHRLNGVTAWFAERSGTLDAAAIEYEIVDEGLLAGAEVRDGRLHVGPGAFASVVLPAAWALDAASVDVLARLIEGGGRVLAVDAAPRTLLGASAAWPRLLAGIEVVSADELPAQLRRGPAPIEVRADAPVLVRAVDDALVIGVFAHDAVAGADTGTGTVQPIIDSGDGYLDWIEGSWSSYWDELRESGYRFRPVGERVARVAIRGAASTRVQRWDPSTGARHELPVRVAVDHEHGDTLHVAVPFDDGSAAVLVVGDALPAADALPVESETGRVALAEWTAEPASLLDNRWGDLGIRSDAGVVPIELWRFETAEGDTAPTEWTPAVAGYGPFARVTGPHDPGAEAAADGWREAEWSLTRGIRDDPSHADTLGPKGFVPDEFLHWDDVHPGQWTAVETTIDAPEGHRLVVGANAEVELRIDGVAAATGDTGYWRAFPIAAGRRRIRIRCTALYAEPLRATFALVADADAEAFRRPEWLEAADGAHPATTLTVATEFEIDGMPGDTRVQVAAEQPCAVLINGVEIGRQGAFAPYSERRNISVLPYDLGPWLTPGTNRLELRSTDLGRPVAVLVDAVPAALGGLGLRTGDGTQRWSAQRDGADAALTLRARQWQHPRFVALVARPHPLPGAAWLDPSPVPATAAAIVPDLDPERTGPRWARLHPPQGATRLAVPSSLAFTATQDGHELHVLDGALELRGSSPVLLRFDEPGGRRGGALLDLPARVLEQSAAPLDGLAPWADLGLGSLGGAVAYRTVLPALPGGARLVLDLGEVRGSVEVRIDGAHVAHRAWGPWRIDVTDAAAEGAELEVRVFGTLAPYLQDASPTPGVFAGQTRTGLFGLVTLRALTPVP